MTHPSYRRLDEPPKLAGFSFMQWVWLLALGAVVATVEHLTSLATQPAISLFTLLVGGPAALVYFSESGRPTLLRLVRDLARWILRAHVHQPGPGRALPVVVRPERETGRTRPRSRDQADFPEKRGLA